MGPSIRAFLGHLTENKGVHPRFSVVIPVQNRADVVGRAIASVVSQTFAEFELILVDDGSTDDSVAAARAVSDQRVRILRQEQRGLDAARVAGMQHSSGSWILFLEADDEVAPAWLARLGRLIDSTDAQLVSCGGEQFYRDGTQSTFRPVLLEPQTADPSSRWHHPIDHGYKACFRSGTFAASRKRLEQVGAFTSLAEPNSSHLLVSTVQSAGVGNLSADNAAPASLRWINPSTFDLANQAKLAAPPALTLLEIGRRLAVSVVTDGEIIGHTPEPLVRWNEAPEEPCADGDALRLSWALQALDAMARTPIPDGLLLARYATIGGIAAARLRQQAQARSMFNLARQASPRVSKHWLRWVASWVAPVSHRIWQPSPESSAEASVPVLSQEGSLLTTPQVFAEADSAA
ncbi:MAG: glycosyltransferase family 2 protein [Microthrixaceae bacterium]